MKREKDITESTLYMISNYIVWFFLGSLYFIILNIPAIFILITAAPPYSINNGLILTYLCFLPIGPAFTALLGVEGKLVREKDVCFTKDFIKMYKLNFKQSFILWAFELLLLTILYYDIKFEAGFLKYLYIGLFLVVFCIGLYAFPIISRFYLRTRDVIRTSFFNFFRYIYISIINIVVGIVFIRIPYIVLLFAISVICYGIMFLENNMLKEIEMMIDKSDESIDDAESDKEDS